MTLYPALRNGAAQPSSFGACRHRCACAQGLSVSLLREVLPQCRKLFGRDPASDRICRRRGHRTSRSGGKCSRSRSAPPAFRSSRLWFSTHRPFQLQSPDSSPDRSAPSVVPPRPAPLWRFLYLAVASVRTISRSLKYVYNIAAPLHKGLDGLNGGYSRTGNPHATQLPVDTGHCHPLAFVMFIPRGFFARSKYPDVSNNARYGLWV